MVPLSRVGPELEFFRIVPHCFGAGNAGRGLECPVDIADRGIVQAKEKDGVGVALKKKAEPVFAFTQRIP